MINGHRQDLGIQILDLFNPRQAQNYKKSYVIGLLRVIRFTI